MRFEWDEAKREATWRKRKLDFAALEEHFDWDTALYRDDLARDEDRVQAIRYLFDTVVVVVFTMRGETCRVISLRKAEPSERRQYERGS